MRDAALCLFFFKSSVFTQYVRLANEACFAVRGDFHVMAVPTMHDAAC